MPLRDYQQAAIDSVFGYWAGGGDSPLVEMATGTGKSMVIAGLLQRLLTTWPDMRVLVLVHVRELVEQDFKALIRVWPSASVGIYSAGLGRRDRGQRIIFGSIQSLYRQDCHSIGKFDLVLIDEAHLVPPGGEGMYRTLLDSLRKGVPDLRVCGFTATPYHTGHGRLDAGDGRLFTDTVTSYGIGPAIEDGWLTPMTAKRTAAEIDVSGVARQGGEFVPGALERAADVDEVTRAAVAEILARGQDRRSWLAFCSGVDHAHHVADALRLAGVDCATITGKTPSAERAQMIRDFRSGRLRCLTNANVLTTGFDAPGVDLIACLRPTLSPGLYVQMMGRGTRVVWPQGFDPDAADPAGRREAIASSSKRNCLVLDFAGNVRRHGPVDMVEIKPPGGGGGEAPVKECPDCQSYVYTAVRVCPDCGHEFPPPAPEEKLETKADTTPILSTELALPEDVAVQDWEGRVHTPRDPDKPQSVCVSYYGGLLTYREWVCPEHTGYARAKFEKWWRTHGGEDAPTSVLETVSRWGELTMPPTIIVRRSGKFWDILGRRFAPVTIGEEAA